MFDHASFNKTIFDRQETAVSSDFPISAYGGVIADFLITYNLEIVLGGNIGDIAGTSVENELVFDIITPLIISLIGASKIELSKLGNTDVSYVYLENITIAPGEEIIIDTDLLTVLLNGTHDVSAITADSVFFELGPGLNDLIFYPEYDNYPDLYSEPTGNELDINLIWQTRWL